MRRLLLGMAAAALLALMLGPGAAALWSVHMRADPDPVPPAAAIVVLGGGMQADGVPGPQTAARVARGVALFLEGRAPLMVMSGGTQGGTLSAAAAMRNAAVEAGVPPGAILAEGESFSTLQNAERTLALLGPEPGRLILVTHSYHLPRARMSFRWAGARDLVGVAADPGEAVAGAALLREAAAGPFNILRAGAARLLRAAGLPEERVEPLLR